MSISSAAGVSTVVQASLMKEQGKQQEAVVNKLIESTGSSSPNSNKINLSGKGGLVSLSA
ncbi:MAG TPA: hypothetical protein PKA63_04810 [Oligoflexia bacterium]|nr:hypothetical protein [Oligoflexia bacterium]HMP47971.1 hypothetical protein [Oligoflexia bacterium]